MAERKRAWTVRSSEWNFEKFLVYRDGTAVTRFRPTVEPESDPIVAAIEANLA